MKIKRTISMLLCMLFLLTSIVTVTFADSISADSEATLVDKKVYANATIDQKFADNRVLVVLDKNAGGINKVHDKSFFGSVEIKAINDLTYMNNYKTENEIASQTSNEKQDTDNVVTPLIDTEAFRQIISLELPINSKKNVLQVIKQLEKIEGIVYAGPDYIGHATSVTPNDNYYNELWGLTKTQVTSAWDTTTGSSNVYVGVIDSGIANHPDLNANLVSGRDFVNNNSITTDDVHGHGTHVAGTIAAVGDNTIGVAGVAWNVKLVPLQVYYDEEVFCYESDTVKAVNYAADNNIPIVNFSIGFESNTNTLEQAIEAYDGLFVCSAGNSTWNLDNPSTPYYPALYNTTNMISVANTTPTDVLNTYVKDGVPRGSNYGATTVHLAAPGTAILSCYPEALCSINCPNTTEPPEELPTLPTGEICGHYTNGYHYDFGTSMASPLVAGVAALMKSANPELTTFQIKAIILNTVTEKDTLAGKCITGGIVNASEAVRIARGLCENTLNTTDKIKADYVFYESTQTIVKYAGTSSTVSIPATIYGTNATTIAAKAFSDNTSIQSVTIPSSITSMGTGVFSGCTSLTTVSIPSTITILPNQTFKDCTSLTNVTIPSSVTSMGTSVFSGCISLTTVSIPSSITILPAATFKDCTQLTNVTIPSSVTSMGINVFSGCTSLTTISIPSSITTLPTGAFKECTKLTNVSLPSNLTGISSNAFNGCEELESITLPSSVVSIGSRAFQNCISLENIVLPSSITTINTGTFTNCKALNSLVIPESVTTINADAFNGCENLILFVKSGSAAEEFADLNSITACVFGSGSVMYYIDGTNNSANRIDIPSTVFGSSITYINSNAFAGSSDLEIINIPDGVTSMGMGAFSGCTSLTTISLPSSITTLSDEIFKDCTSLVSVTLPSTITSMGTSVFSGCTSLTTVSLPSAITTLPAETFKRCIKLTNVTLPSNLTNILDYAFAECHALKSINLPSSLAIIEANAFQNCISLENIVLPSSLTLIRTGAFADCKALKSLVIPESVTSINTDAFNGCEKLILFVKSGSAAEAFADLNSITACVFGSGRVMYYIDGTNNSANRIDIPSAVFGSSITHINSNAFAGSSDLEIINIPEGVASIGYKAFQSCPNLKTIVMPMSVSSISNSMNSYVTIYSDNATICCMSGSDAERYAINNNITRMVMKPSATSPDTECYLDELYEEGEGCGEYIIPDSIKGLAVTEIGECVLNAINATKITILSPDIELNEFTFGYCDYLTDIYIYSKTATLYDNSFWGTDTSMITLHCYAGSQAYRYAVENEISFALM